MEGMEQLPHLDAAPPTPQQVQAQNPFGDLELASKNYWAGRTGREDPPAPTYRMVGGKRMLGRYMDPYGCQGHMRSAHIRWQNWYTGFFVALGIGVLLGPDTDFVSLIIAGLPCAIWYFCAKRSHRKQYDLYYGIQERIIETGEPQWVPYDKTRLELLDRNPLAVWP
jgi:hypothetical protein